MYNDTDPWTVHCPIHCFCCRLLVLSSNNNYFTWQHVVGSICLRIHVYQHFISRAWARHIRCVHCQTRTSGEYIILLINLPVIHLLLSFANLKNGTHRFRWPSVVSSSTFPLVSHFKWAKRYILTEQIWLSEIILLVHPKEIVEILFTNIFRNKAWGKFSI